MSFVIPTKQLMSSTLTGAQLTGDSSLHQKLNKLALLEKMSCGKTMESMSHWHDTSYSWLFRYASHSKQSLGKREAEIALEKMDDITIKKVETGADYVMQYEDDMMSSEGVKGHKIFFWIGRT